MEERLIDLFMVMADFGIVGKGQYSIVMNALMRAYERGQCDRTAEYMELNETVKAMQDVI